MGQQKSPKNHYLMILMRALLTDGVRVCQVKAYHTELATTCPCMAPIEIHDSETHWTSTLDITNAIHDHIMIFMIYLTRVVTHKRLDECLGLDSILACVLLLNFWPHSSPFTHYQGTSNRCHEHSDERNANKCVCLDLLHSIQKNPSTMADNDQ